MKLGGLITALAAAACILAGPSIAAAKEKVVLSTDMVDLFDDGVAMLLLAKNPDTDLLGVSVVIGNSWVESGTASAIRQLEGAGRTDIPVFCGVNSLTREGRIESIELEKELFGRGADSHNGAAGVPRPESWQAAYRNAYKASPTTAPRKEHGADFIIDTVKSNPGEVTIIAIGTYNNLAAAVRKAPEIVPMVKRVIYMGGAFFQPGNVMPNAEFNIWMDPEAARFVWRQPFREQVVFPLDCCEKIHFTKERHDRLAGMLKSKIFKDMFTGHWTTAAFKADPKFHTFVWDVLCSAYVIDPSIITAEETLPVDVNVTYGPTYGETLAYRGSAPLGARRARIVLEVDENKIWKQVEGLFRSL